MNHPTVHSYGSIPPCIVSMQWPTAVKDLSCPNTTLYSVHFKKLTGAARRFKLQIKENSRFTINRFNRKQKQGINSRGHLVAEIDPLGIMEGELKDKFETGLSVQINEKSEKQNVLRERLNEFCRFLHSHLERMICEVVQEKVLKVAKMKQEIFISNGRGGNCKFFKPKTKSLGLLVEEIQPLKTKIHKNSSQPPEGIIQLFFVLHSSEDEEWYGKREDKCIATFWLTFSLILKR
ncbi:hypothetical protein ACFE04_019806 [Oxalis oulophora]